MCSDCSSWPAQHSRCWHSCRFNKHRLYYPHERSKQRNQNLHLNLRWRKHIESTAMSSPYQLAPKSYLIYEESPTKVFKRTVDGSQIFAFASHRRRENVPCSAMRSKGQRMLQKKAQSHDYGRWPKGNVILLNCVGTLDSDGYSCLCAVLKADRQLWWQFAVWLLSYTLEGN